MPFGAGGTGSGELPSKQTATGARCVEGLRGRHRNSRCDAGGVAGGVAGGGGGPAPCIARFVGILTAAAAAPRPSLPRILLPASVRCHWRRVALQSETTANR